MATWRRPWKICSSNAAAQRTSSRQTAKWRSCFWPLSGFLGHVLDHRKVRYSSSCPSPMPSQSVRPGHSRPFLPSPAGSQGPDLFGSSLELSSSAPWFSGVFDDSPVRCGWLSKRSPMVNLPRHRRIHMAFDVHYSRASGCARDVGSGRPDENCLAMAA